jgi:hypothetical protein
MNAKEARALTNKNLMGPAIKEYMDVIHDHISMAAQRGESNITNPLYVGRKSVPFHLHEAVLDALRSEGFKIVDHPDPDPGHPASGPYTTLSW